MAKVVFNYNGINTTITCDYNEKIKRICQNFCTKANIDKNDIFFTYGGNAGNQFNEELTFIQMANNFDKENRQMNVLVQKLNKSNSESKFIKPKEIICPECGENIRINIKDYIITLHECKNGHKTDNIPLDEYEKKQILDLSKIKCDNCKENNKGNVFNNEFYKCCSCNKNLCPMCKSVHNSLHNIINYDEINIFVRNIKIHI